MTPPLVILLIGLVYGVLAGGLALFRREGLSMRFAVETAAVTIFFSGLVALTGLAIDPVLFLVLLYLLTMRVRILVDLGSAFARQGKHPLAEKLYTLAGRLWPDAASGLALKVNQATLLLQENQLDDSIAIFTEVLQQAGRGYLGVKYEAAAHYNLGVAFLRQKNLGRARVEFNAAIDTWPASLYAQRAQEALNRYRGVSGPATPSDD